MLWIQNDLFAKWYVRDGDEFREQKPEVEIEGEGILHGKKIIVEGDVGEDKCPFSGAVKGVEDLVIEDCKNEDRCSGCSANVNDVPRPAEPGR